MVPGGGGDMVMVRLGLCPGLWEDTATIASTTKENSSKTSPLRFDLHLCPSLPPSPEGTKDLLPVLRHTTPAQARLTRDSLCAWRLETQRLKLKMAMILAANGRRPPDVQGADVLTKTGRWEDGDTVCKQRNRCKSKAGRVNSG